METKRFLTKREAEDNAYDLINASFLNYNEADLIDAILNDTDYIYTHLGKQYTSRVNDEYFSTLSDCIISYNCHAKKIYALHTDTKKFEKANKLLDKICVIIAKHVIFKKYYKRAGSAFKKIDSLEFWPLRF